MKGYAKSLHKPQGSQLPEAGTNAMVVLCDAYPLRINKAAEVTCFEFV